MEPRIETCKETKLIGKKIRMCFANNKTAELWRSFIPRRKEIKNFVNADLYSVEIYPNTAFCEDFNPMQEFEKWAATEVRDFDTILDDMEKLIIPSGQYAVFYY
ncbi:MAG: transcription activator effector binding protein [Anaerosolibacter sp.]|jgi:AraC family transcriptional regulator|nr:transcription activator effector binding protein [Anaerosolibacter sp.]